MSRRPGPRPKSLPADTPDIPDTPAAAGRGGAAVSVTANVNKTTGPAPPARGTAWRVHSMGYVSVRRRPPLRPATAAAGATIRRCGGPTKPGRVYQQAGVAGVRRPTVRPF